MRDRLRHDNASVEGHATYLQLTGVLQKDTIPVLESRSWDIILAGI